MRRFLFTQLSHESTVRQKTIVKQETMKSDASEITALTCRVRTLEESNQTLQRTAKNFDTMVKELELKNKELEAKYKKLEALLGKQ